MSDERLREAERKWRETGAVEDEARYLLERVRVGDLTRERLELAAYCGHGAARRALNVYPQHSLADLLRSGRLTEALQASPWRASFALEWLERVILNLRADLELGPEACRPYIDALTRGLGWVPADDRSQAERDCLGQTRRSAEAEKDQRMRAWAKLVAQTLRSAYDNPGPHWASAVEFATVDAHEIRVDLLGEDEATADRKIAQCAVSRLLQ